MSGADWQPGDLALCVRGGVITGGHKFPEPGRVYHVIGVRPQMWTDGETDLGLILDKAPKNRSGLPIWWHRRFIKITPGSEITGNEAEKRIPIPHLFPETV